MGEMPVKSTLQSPASPRTPRHASWQSEDEGGEVVFRVRSVKERSWQ